MRKHLFAHAAEGAFFLARMARPELAITPLTADKEENPNGNRVSESV
jgi:hypothetical protein